MIKLALNLYLLLNISWFRNQKMLSCLYFNMSMNVIRIIIPKLASRNYKTNLADNNGIEPLTYLILKSNRSLL